MSDAIYWDTQHYYYSCYHQSNNTTEVLLAATKEVAHIGTERHVCWLRLVTESPFYPQCFLSGILAPSVSLPFITSCQPRLCKWLMILSLAQNCRNVCAFLPSELTMNRSCNLSQWIVLKGFKWWIAADQKLEEDDYEGNEEEMTDPELFYITWLYMSECASLLCGCYFV